MRDEAKLFVSMTYDLHHEYWQSWYENEIFQTILNAELETPEKRVVRGARSHKSPSRTLKFLI